ncbi:MAG: serine--tRNA ligase [Candidatus Brocadia sp. AMX2]|uniref:Serine--tRNA ligase n=1 Tax=Candidatus Brocadia sinica JPN1 TaxID=1197129 RepID=A0ABQ0K089_9BACT|nr:MULTISPECIES: serine--tRNA ligase [Brocadia]KXK29143.1 MAG: seryl-tRNA synthase [Candidatus Brocadia sinica]MBC6933589.1 serine--tRNA ligase [Candidatus Brocadia sp.]MBL1170390.1 serine--tRNA ligase [Candidatus Brocadia sp. AMX1]NOG42306.1 serine--tRNA ligase [Planctomycetota bacterium]KAA0241594.1 MAG: serine--tRNA ligase [Candidatus Brocadia sp. AMX2]
MLDINFIRNNPDKVKQAIAHKHENAANIDQILELDTQRRSLIHACEQLKSKRNEKSKEVSELKKRGQDASGIIEETKKIGDDIKSFEEKLKELEPQITNLLLRIPNIPAADVPIGKDENDNVVVKTWGQRKTFDFSPLPHWELGRILNILDLERSSKISGSGFILLKGPGAKLERALFCFMLDTHTREHGYTELFPPFLVNRTSMTGTGQLPKLEEDMYRTAIDDLFLVPTAEVPVTNIHRDEILSYKDLPIYYTAYTPCFRREAGSYGKDTRGIIRVHQFNKVELVKIVKPEASYNEIESLLGNAERILQLLGLEYRVAKLCTGDMSFAAAKCYDIEVWAPGTGKFLEVSSCSNFEDFQARRMNIRFRDEDGKLRFVHTLNGSGLALPRTVIALLETYQQKDGTVIIPDILKPYMGGMKVIGRR